MKTPKDYERMRQAKADKRQALATAPTTQEVGLSVNPAATEPVNRVLTLHSHECTMCLTC